jgi:hypothetical protein
VDVVEFFEAHSDSDSDASTSDGAAKRKTLDSESGSESGVTKKQKVTSEREAALAPESAPPSCRALFLFTQLVPAK